MENSRQEKFKSEDPNDFFATVMRSFDDDDPRPEYSADSRKLDEWMLRFVRREPHLHGILSSVTAIDKNRGWSLVGGRNQVKRYSEMLHRFHASPGVNGWRPSFAQLSASFWGTNMGAIVEIGRDGRDGPVVEMYTADPTKFTLNRNMTYPISYHPRGGKVQKWADKDFFRVCSLPSVREEMNGLGSCAVDRAIQLAELMIALFRHDEEKLLARAPRGLLMLSGIKRDQWDKAMEARDASLDSAGNKYFGSIAVLASASATVDAKLLALSELPTSFNLRDWMDMTMYGYSLCFGYDPSEFWPVQYGALGRGNETQIQHEKATGKGRLDFVLGFQEQITNFLPDSLDFVVEQRDDQGDLLRASVVQAWVNVAKTLYEANNGGIPLVTNEEARVLLAEYGVIPTTWSPTADSKGTDVDDPDDDEVVEQPGDNESTEGVSPKKTGESEITQPSANPSAQLLRPSFRTSKLEHLRQSLIDKASVRQAAMKYPYEPIVQYNYPANTMIELWSSGEDLMKPKIWKGMR